ncbi:hypothetical protein N7457_003191 [Penicillium paradoxum]|uniref:uncharacterized protein n=1 Tax=Penicillium paradoxum TaxID=176176 RepID=UPI00254695DA|nr:uncharacterized protein N7457_003191 [Penicillium paradoxum]KAJ5788201.1 hypothetical protein N7457_003191 [Penicillium paradoxum]
MAEPPPDSSYTPPHTPLIEESPFISDFMEDLDPQATRKRPRLDSGSRVSPTLSLEGTSRTASIAPASDMDQTSDSGNPASRVTINTKSPAMTPSLLPSDPELPDNDLELQQHTDTTPNVISLPSSPSTPEAQKLKLLNPKILIKIRKHPTGCRWVKWCGNKTNRRSLRYKM